MKTSTNRYVKAAVIGLIIVAVFGFTIYQFYKQAWLSTDRIIANQVEHLAELLQSIDDSCVIAAVAHERNYIDFLNVRSFSGSEVGCLNLVNPSKWKGPYLPANYTMQGKAYEIIKTEEGYYVVPGDGVQLSNKKIIGKDIIFTKKSDIESFVNNKVGLEHEGKPLALRLHLKLDKTRDISVMNEPGVREEE